MRWRLLGLAFVLCLLSLPALSFGTSRGMALLWWMGLLALGVGGLIPVLLRAGLFGRGEER